MTILFTTGSYFFIDSLFGYSVKQSDEDKFFLVSYYVPDDETEIFLWVILENEVEPKAVTVPYTQQRHKELVRAEEQMKNGARFVGRFSEMESELPQQNSNDEAREETEEEIVSTMAAGGTKKSQGGGFSLIHVAAQPHMMRKY